MSNPPLIPRCGYFGQQHELQDEIRRNRARFRRRTKPYLRGVLCYCTRPWNPEPDFRPQTRRAFWMRVHALALLDALEPLDPSIRGDLAVHWRGIELWEDDERPMRRYVEAIEIAVGVPDWSAVARALRALGYRVEGAAAVAGIDGDGDFPVVVRNARAGDDAIDATALRAEMAERYPARVVELYGRG